MKRLIAWASIIVPAALLAIFALFPSLDGTSPQPILHFYLVTFFTFSVAVVSTATALSLGQDSPVRHHLLTTAGGAMAAIFFVHGALTVGALTFTFNPGIQWGAWLTLLVGGILFALAAYDRPDAALPQRHLPTINGSVVLFYLAFILIIGFRPEWLADIDQVASPLHSQLVFGLSLVAWAYAAIRLWPIWRHTRQSVDGMMALIAGWMVIATFSLHRFPIWNWSWWTYHYLLLLAAFVATGSLAAQYEQVREFRLIRYYAVASIIVTGALAFVASFLFARTVEGELVSTLSARSIGVGRNLATNLVSDLPTMATTADLREFVGNNEEMMADTLTTRSFGLDIGRITIYDNGATPVYNGDEGDGSVSRPNTAAIRAALAGQAGTELITSVEPLFTGSDASTYLQTYVPIISSTDAPIGVLGTIQAIDGLEEAVVRARRTGLLVAGFSMGLLFLALLGIVRRADRLITKRTEELARAYRDLQAAEAMRDDLTDMIIHDLRSPLTSMRLSLEMLRKSAGDPTKEDMREKFFRNARASVQRMIQLVNNLLDVTRLEAGRLRLSRSRVDVTTLLSERADVFMPQAEVEGKAIIVQMEDDLPLLEVDGDLLERVMDNLVGNALKYTERGGHIWLYAERLDSSLLVRVRDDGEGVAPEHAAAIFDKFAQVTDESGQPKRRGVGLGLTFCKLVVEAHNGRIWLESEPSVGSTFSFTLPFSPDSSPPTEVESVTSEQPVQVA